MLSGCSLLATVLLVLMLQLTSSLNGIDLNTVLTVSEWQELITSFELTFAIVKIFNYDGTINPHAVRSINAAWAAGIRDISVYWIPCITGSAYEIGSTTMCGTPPQQVAEVLSVLSRANIFFVEFNKTTSSPTFSPSTSPSFSNQRSFRPTNNPTSAAPTSPSAEPTSLPTYLVSPTATPTTILDASGALLQRIYVSVEDEVPNRFYIQNSVENYQYLIDFEAALYEYGIDIGIYTTPLDWHNIMEIDGQIGNTVNYFRHNPLWMPRYDKVTNMDFFEPFSGWTSVFIKQITGGSADMRRTGSSRVCLNYMTEISRDRYTNTNKTISLSG